MMHTVIIGAGSMGGLYGGLLANAGYKVSLVDAWQDHVDAIGARGLHLDGISGDFELKIPASSDPTGEHWADLAIILVHAYNTQAAAGIAKRILKEDGAVLTLQNGVGNIENLTAELGAQRVLGGLSYHSSAMQGPGHVTHTHRGPTWLGEIDGQTTDRLKAIEQMFAAAELEPVIVDDILGYIWSKLIHNSAINPVCAMLGLRVGEIPTTPGADDLQTRIIEEALAVIQAKGIDIAEDDPMTAIKEFCKLKFNKPSMLQHMESGRRTEIEALNGAIVREGRSLGVATPFNEAVTWIVEGMQAQRIRINNE